MYYVWYIGMDEESCLIYGILEEEKVVDIRYVFVFKVVFYVYLVWMILYFIFVRNFVFIYNLF